MKPKMVYLTKEKIIKTKFIGFLNIKVLKKGIYLLQMIENLFYSTKKILILQLL